MTVDSDFLYPFLDGDAGDEVALLDDLAASAAAKFDHSAAVARRTLDANAEAVEAAAAAMHARFSSGGTLFVFGNGGSATDAAAAARLFAAPPAGRPLAARCLAAEPAVLTAVGNDVGFDLVFARQLIAHGHAGDIALALSTSGSSTNLLVALDEARRRGMLTVGIAGYDGGEMAVAGLDHCLVVPSDSVHRIQEAQHALLSGLWQSVQHRSSGAPTGA